MYVCVCICMCVCVCVCVCVYSCCSYTQQTDSQNVCEHIQLSTLFSRADLLFADIRSVRRAATACQRQRIAERERERARDCYSCRPLHTHRPVHLPACPCVCLPPVSLTVPVRTTACVRACPSPIGLVLLFVSASRSDRLIVGPTVGRVAGRRGRRSTRSANHCERSGLSGVGVGIRPDWRTANDAYWTGMH